MRWVSFVLALCMICFVKPVLARELPDAGKLLSYLKIDPSGQDALFSGAILKTDVVEASDKELAVGAVMYLPVPVTDLVETVRAGKLFSLDHDLMEHGEITDKYPEIQVSLTEEEARELGRVEPGSKFNLSSDEIRRIRELAAQGTDPGRVVRTYRTLLQERYQAYRKAGLMGIAPYARSGGKKADPSDEIRKGLGESVLLATYFPEFHKALADFPKGGVSGMTQRFFWLNERVEDRPTLILVHRLSYVTPNEAFMAERQYYVGHSYNSLQLLAGCFPARNGTLVFYSNRTCTDQVAGFASGMRHGIGRERMRDEIVKGFEAFRASLPH